MKDGIIFVAGIYGVGKSTLCERLTTAYAFALGSFKRYETSKSLADFNIQSAPQSFVYLDD